MQPLAPPIPLSPSRKTANEKIRTPVPSRLDSLMFTLLYCISRRCVRTLLAVSLSFFRANFYLALARPPFLPSTYSRPFQHTAIARCDISNVARGKRWYWGLGRRLVCGYAKLYDIVPATRLNECRQRWASDSKRTARYK